MTAKNPLTKKLEPLTKDPTLKAMLRKMVEPSESTYGSRSTLPAPDEMILRSISDTTTANIMDSRSIYQLLPDLELAEQILISSILSPKDMVTVDLQYSVAQGSMESEFAAPLLKVIANYWDRDYKINEKLEEWLSDILFHRGSHPIAILPEGSIDAMINNSGHIGKESLSAIFTNGGGSLHFKGLLGSPTAKAPTSNGVTLESSLNDLATIGNTPAPTDALMKFDASEFKEYQLSIKDTDFTNTVTVTDNYEMLRVPSLMKHMTERRVQQTLALNKVGLETRNVAALEARKEEFSASQIREFEDTLYPKRGFKVMGAQAVPTSTAPSHGHPLALDLPSEACIPVFVPGYPKKHIGMFVLLDINGNPVSNATRTDYYSELSKNLAMRREVTNATVAGNGVNNNIFTDVKGRYEIDLLAKTYGRIVEADLLTRLKNGAYGNNVQINAPEEIYRVMLARTFAKQKTQLLYIPEELFTYMAFEYNEYGVGTSLIDKTKVLSAMRAMLSFANTMAAVKNAVGRTSVNITLDEEDPNPADTVEKLMHSFVNGNSARFPLGASSAKDITDYLQKAGVGMSVTGNSRYPNTSMSVDDKSSQKVLVDTDLTDNLKKQQIMALGLPPESVDLGMNVEYATSLIASNLLLAKRASNSQRKFLIHVQDFVFKFTRNSELLVSELTEIAKAHKANIPKAVKDLVKDSTGAIGEANLIDMAVSYFLENLQVTLPSADMASLEAKVTALEAYIKGVDLMLDAFLASAMYNEDTEGAIAANIDVYRECIKAYFVKMWAVQNDFMPEMLVMMEKDKDGKNIFDLVELQGEAMTDLNNIIADFTIYIDKEKKKRDERLTKAGVGEAAPVEDESGDTVDNTDETKDQDFNDDLTFDDSSLSTLDSEETKSDANAEADDKASEKANGDVDGNDVSDGDIDIEDKN